VKLRICLVALSLALPLSCRAQSGTSESPAPTNSSGVSAASLHQKATEAQARVRANEGDRDLLRKAVKINEVALAKEVLLRNGFTAEDLQHAKIILQTGGGKDGADEIEISAACCDPKEITIQRTLSSPTK
jgi:hypothetical protein